MRIVKLLLLELLIFASTSLANNKFYDFQGEQYTRERQTRFVGNILKLYAGSSLMLHVENSTYHSIDFMLKLIYDNHFGEVIFLNQDDPTISNFWHRKGSSFLHLVIFRNPKKYEQYLELPDCLGPKDVVLFFTFNSTNWLQDEFWTMHPLSWAGNVMILNISDTSVSLYNVCYYCGSFSKKLKHLQTSNTSLLNIDNSDLLPRNFSNFYNHQLEIGYIVMFPYVWCEAATDEIINSDVFKTCTKASGMEIGVLNLLSKKLNFTYRLIEYGYSLRQSDGNINKVGSITLDFLVGAISITTARAPKMSFTTTLAFEPCIFLYVPRKTFSSDLLGILKPFKGTLWLAVTFATWGFSVSLYISIKTVGSNLRERSFPFSTCLKVCYKAIIEQSENSSLHYFRAHITPYLVLLLWWCTSSIIVTAFRSKLWAISIMNYHVEPSNLEELLNNGYNIVVNVQNWDVMEDILTDTDPMTRKVKKNLILKDYTCTSIAYVIKHRAAMLEERATIQYHALVECSDILNADTYPKLRIAKTPLRSTSHSWPLQIGAPYKNAFDRFIQQVHSTGLETKWKSDSLTVISNKYDNIPYSQATTKEMTSEYEFLKGFLSPFFFYILGNAVSILCFISELAYVKMTTK